MDTLWKTQFPNDTEEFADEFGYRHVERRTEVEGAGILQMQKGMTTANVSRLETMTGTMPQVQKNSEQVSGDVFDINFENTNEVQQNNAIHMKNQLDKNKKGVQEETSVAKFERNNLHTGYNYNVGKEAHFINAGRTQLRGTQEWDVRRTQQKGVVQPLRSHAKTPMRFDDRDQSDYAKIALHGKESTARVSGDLRFSNQPQFRRHMPSSRTGDVAPRTGVQGEQIVRAGDMPQLDMNSRETHAFSAMRARTDHLMNGSDAYDAQDVINNRSGFQQGTLLAEYTMHGSDAMKQETSKRQSFQIAAMNTSMYIANGADATKKAMSKPEFPMFQSEAGLVNVQTGKEQRNLRDNPAVMTSETWVQASQSVRGRDGNTDSVHNIRDDIKEVHGIQAPGLSSDEARPQNTTSVLAQRDDDIRHIQDVHARPVSSSSVGLNDGSRATLTSEARFLAPAQSLWSTLTRAVMSRAFSLRRDAGVVNDGHLRNQHNLLGSHLRVKEAATTRDLRDDAINQAAQPVRTKHHVLAMDGDLPSVNNTKTLPNTVRYATKPQTKRMPAATEFITRAKRNE